MRRFILLAVATLLFSSCATIFTGTKARVVIDANIPEADYVSIDGYKHRNVTFPFQTKVRRGFNETVVTAKREGYKESQVLIDKDFNVASVFNLTNLFGWGIDAISGAITKPEYKWYELEFVKEWE